MLLTGRNRVHDLLSLLLVVDFKGKEIFWSSQLELGSVALLVFFNDDFFGFWEVLLLSPHDLNEFLQVLDFLWLKKQESQRLACDEKSVGFFEA